MPNRSQENARAAQQQSHHLRNIASAPVDTEQHQM